MRPNFIISLTAGFYLLVASVSPGAAQTSLDDPFDVPGPARAFGTPGTPPNVTVCPRTKPFKCENGDCVTNPTKCRPTQSCPPDRPLRCTNGNCVSKPSECDVGTRCPAERPVRCPRGGCVADRRDCPVPGFDNQ